MIKKEGKKVLYRGACQNAPKASVFHQFFNVHFSSSEKALQKQKVAIRKVSE